MKNRIVQTGETCRYSMLILGDELVNKLLK